MYKDQWKIDKLKLKVEHLLTVQHKYCTILVSFTDMLHIDKREKNKICCLRLRYDVGNRICMKSPKCNQKKEENEKSKKTCLQKCIENYIKIIGLSKPL